MKVLIALAVTMFILTTQARRIPNNHDSLSDLLSEYAGNSMLNQASGGLLGSNQSLVGSLANKLLGVPQPQSGLQGMINQALGKQPEQPTGMAAQINKFLGGNQQPQP